MSKDLHVFLLRFQATDVGRVAFDLHFETLLVRGSLLEFGLRVVEISLELLSFPLFSLRLVLLLLDIRLTLEPDNNKRLSTLENLSTAQHQAPSIETAIYKHI